MSTEGGTKAVVAALIANTGIAIAKFVAFAFTGSSSMMSEGIHSVADSCNQVLLLIGGRRAKRKPDEQHQFGYGRTRYVYGFIVAIILFLVGGLFAFTEGLHKVQHPEPLRDVWWAVGVLVFAILLEAYSLSTAVKEANKSRGKRSMLKFVRESRQPELPVILLEDIGAMVGLVLALIGVSAAIVTGNGVWDGLGSMGIGALLIIIAVFLAFEMASMLIGESALPADDSRIRKALEETPDVHRVIHMKTLHVGPDDLLVAAKFEIESSDTGAEIAKTIDAAERNVRAVVPTATYIYLEPDLFRKTPPAESPTQEERVVEADSHDPGNGQIPSQ